MGKGEGGGRGGAPDPEELPMPMLVCKVPVLACGKERGEGGGFVHSGPRPGHSLGEEATETVETKWRSPKVKFTETPRKEKETLTKRKKCPEESLMARSTPARKETQSKTCEVAASSPKNQEKMRVEEMRKEEVA